MSVSINGSTGITGAIDVQSTGSVLSGVTTVSAGTTSAPSITPSGDSNTGVFFPSADTIAFAEGGIEAARFDSSGRMLVGTSTSRTVDSVQHQLQVEGGFTPYGGARISSFFNAEFGPSVSLTHSRSSTVGTNTIVQSGDRVGNVAFYGADGTNYVPTAAILAAVDGTPGSNDMPGRLVFSTTADGASSPTEQLRITSDRYVRLASGTGGIQFGGDTAAANALDDYEEGTWTPTIFGASVSGTTTYDAFQRGNYVKIGSLVSVRMFVRISGATGSGQLKIGGFPFTSSEPNDSGCFLFTSGLNWGGGTCLWFDFPGNRTAGEVYYLADDASATAQSITNESSDFRFSFSYITSS